VAKSTGIVLVAGTITASNELLFAPLAGTGKAWTGFNWRILPATGLLALALGGLEQIAPPFAVGLAWLTLVSALILPIGKAATPVDNLVKFMGYGGK
jgi:hypothetical protein